MTGLNTSCELIFFYSFLVNLVIMIDLIDEIDYNMIRDAIKPDLTMFLHYETLEIKGKQVVEIDIQRGTA